MPNISTVIVGINHIVSELRYERKIKKMQKNIGPYVPTPHVVQIWA